jgi:2-polyprenyl-3-methyl-5-hydroxy-6-metoxy-1,4-benzoquinol methylase
MKNSYTGYFKEHYKSRLSEADVLSYRKWFFAQWKIIQKQVAIKPTLSVLEIGSGLGGVYSFLQEAGIKDYVGIELDREVVDFSNAYFKTDVFRVTSIEDLPTDKKFDLILAFEVMEHIENPSAVLAKVHQLLRPGGVFCGTTPFPFRKNVYADETHLSVLHPANWQRLFNHAHFSNCRLQSMSFFPILWRVSKSINVRLPFYIPFKGFVATCLFIATK